MRIESAPCNHPGTQGDKGCGVFNTWLPDCSGAKVAHGRFSRVSRGSDTLPFSSHPIVQNSVTWPHLTIREAGECLKRRKKGGLMNSQKVSVI